MSRQSNTKDIFVQDTVCLTLFLIKYVKDVEVSNEYIQKRWDGKNKKFYVMNELYLDDPHLWWV